MDPNPATQFEISNPTDMQDDAVQLCCHDDMMFRASSLVLIEYVTRSRWSGGKLELKPTAQQRLGVLQERGQNFLT